MKTFSEKNQRMDYYYWTHHYNNNRKYFPRHSKASCLIAQLIFDMLCFLLNKVENTMLSCYANWQIRISLDVIQDTCNNLFNVYPIVYFTEYMIMYPEWKY